MLEFSINNSIQHLESSNDFYMKDTKMHSAMKGVGVATCLKRESQLTWFISIISPQP